MSTLKLTSALIAAAALVAPSIASAQIRSEPVNPPPTELPPPQSDNDPTPPAAKPQGPNAGITKQAGVGGTQAYGRAGVLELGGAIGFTAAEDYAQFRATPSIGWFFADNLQLSFLLGINYTSISDGDVESSATAFSGVIEPSYHLPFSDTVFGFLGIGAGFGVVSSSTEAGGQTIEDDSTGFLISPRLGMNFMVGRSGVLTPYLHVNYTTGDVLQVGNQNAVAVNVAYGGNIGYTVMW